MADLLILGSTITTSDINECVTFFNRFCKNGTTSELVIRATQKLEDVDISLIGYFLLFKDTLPNLRIRLELPYNIDDSSFEYKIHQFGAYTYLLTGKEVFTAVIGNKSHHYNFENEPAFKTNHFVLSEHFMLLFFVSNKEPELFSTLFEKPISSNIQRHLRAGLKGINWQAANDKLYNTYNEKLRQVVPKYRRKAIVALGQLAFYKSLANAYILPFYVDKRYNLDSNFRDDEIYAGNLSSKVSSRGTSWFAYEYFEAVKPIFDDLATKPLIYHFVFSTLTASDVLPSKLTREIEDTRQDFIGGLFNLWHFTIDLVHGLIELAKNIQQHASPASGVITARIHTEKKFKGLQEQSNEGNTLFKDYLDWISNNVTDKAKALLEIRVFDMGEKGIISTLLESTEAFIRPLTADAILRRFLEEDMELLQNNEVQLKHLLLQEDSKRLNQQSKRSIAHIGLLRFSRLIQENNGMIVASSLDINNNRKPVVVPILTEQKYETVNAGTNYTILLPIVFLEPYVTQLPHSLRVPSDSTVEEIHGLEDLFKYKIISTSDLPLPFSDTPVLLLCKLPNQRINDRSKEQTLWDTVYGSISQFASNKRDLKNYVINIDFERVAINESQLFRFLGQWGDSFPKNNLLISNITTETFLTLQQINEDFTQQAKPLSYWNSQSVMIVYHYVFDEHDRFYFTDALWGKTYEDFFLLNKSIQRNHFNAIGLTQPQKEIYNKSQIIVPPTNHLIIYDENILLPFDVILTGNNEVTLFEHNATMLLKNEMKLKKVSTRSENLLDSVKSLPGYKISNSHFRLGSKIHISDFYYAKRFFQNNFFASRFAFMVAKEIIKTIPDNILSEVKNVGVTLIGYGLYSELLMSLIEKFLKHSNSLGTNNIEHNLVEDSEKLKLIKHNKPKGYIIIIVPIASTFSTSIKIEASLKSKSDLKFIQPHFNLLHIANKSANDEILSIEEEFGWTKKNTSKREVELTAFFETSPEVQRVQRYFLQLFTKWQRIEKCDACFPIRAGMDIPLDEEPLFETDRTSVTPTMILDYPQSRKIEVDDEKREYKLTHDMVHYGHHMRNHIHFIYSINTELFLQENYQLVSTWLDSLHKKPPFNKEILGTDHVLLISSCHFSNASLLNLVNEVLFSSAANIIHYDPDQDYIQNFDVVYGPEIRRADKIIFVDDSLKSGKTFSKINDFVKYTLRNGDRTLNDVMHGKANGIDCCIFLLNKAQPFTMHMVENKMRKNKYIYSFANLHLFTSLTYNDSIPAMTEEKRYKSILADSFLDSLKLHFFKQIDKIKVDTLPSKSTLKSQRHLLMLDATHRLYQFFAKNEIEEKSSFNEFVLSLFQKTISPIIYNRSSQTDSLRFTERHSTMLKVLTQLPFTQFEPVRKMVFKWVLIMLDEQLITVRNQVNSSAFNYGHFVDLKFLVRRAGLLNSNFLISQNFLSTLQILYSEGGIPTLIRKMTMPFVAARVSERNTNQNELRADDVRIDKLRSFHVFYEAQVKELLYANEARSIRLGQVMNQVGSDGRGYNQIARILRVENSIIIQRFYDFLANQEEWIQLYPESDDIIDENTERIKNFLQSNTINKHHRFKALNEFFSATDQKNPLENETFHDYLWLQYFLTSDLQGKKLELTKKTEYNFRKLKLILRYSKESNNDISRIGAFMIIKGSENSYFMAYDGNEEGRRELDPNNWRNNEDSLLTDFLEGKKDASRTYFKSIMELRLNPQTRKWDDLYGTDEETQPPQLRSNFLPDYINRIILIRLSRRIDKVKEKVHGFIAFYFHSKTNNMVETNCIQYLILLRKELSSFVERHYQNNEFQDWFFADSAKRLAMLSGHGRFMLQKLSAKYENFLTIALNIEHLQMIILLENSVRSKTGVESTETIFNKFYDVKGVKTINKKKYLGGLEKMAQQIYAAEEVEMPVDLSSPIVSYTQTDFDFAFNKNILDLICFELILNAKKNRWHHLPDDPEVCKNRLSIEMELDNMQRLRICISNTGPTVDPVDLLHLNDPIKNVKKEEITSGTALIKTLVRKILKGECKFKTREVCSDVDFSEFTAEIVLNEMN